MSMFNSFTQETKAFNWKRSNSHPSNAFRYCIKMCFHHILVGTGYDIVIANKQSMDRVDTKISS
jgi:hypothetical protein